ncbi:MAG TPA: DUF1232 domain-containing protein [Desulfobulbus sp.]|nr:DUF1232 domain-containing protein [Desulfobulbus sp.]
MKTFFPRVVTMVRHAVAVFLDHQTPLYVKLLLGAGLLYVVSPYDLIPEWIPVLGVMDDLALVALLVAWANGFQVSGKP